VAKFENACYVTLSVTTLALSRDPGACSICAAGSGTCRRTPALAGGARVCRLRLRM